MNAPGRRAQPSHEHGDGPMGLDPRHQADQAAQQGQGGQAGSDLQSGAPRCKVPASPDALVAMQRRRCEPLPPQDSEDRLAGVLAQLRSEGLSPWESQQIALVLLEQLESYHRAVLTEMQRSEEGTTAQVACWAIDGDRLMHCRRLLESITLI